MPAMEKQVAQLEVKVDAYRSDMADLKAAIATLEQKMEQRFKWVVGIQFATLFAIIAGMVGIIAKLL